MALRGYYLGCPGWGMKSWIGRLFPAGTKQHDFLPRYAEVFNTVEGNTTFYALPAADVVERWRDSVPDAFRFCFKFPRTITHDKLLVDAAPEVSEFIARIAPLGHKLGTLMLQLPHGSARASSAGSRRSSMRCLPAFSTRSSYATSCSSPAAPKRTKRWRSCASARSIS